MKPVHFFVNILIPLLLASIGLWDITHQTSLLGFGPETMSGSFRVDDNSYSLQGLPAVINGLSFLIMAVALHLGLWVHLRSKQWPWIGAVRVGTWVLGVLLFLTAHWILQPLMGE